MPAAPPHPARRLRMPALLRPVGRARWGMAVALAVALGGLLLVPAAQGRAPLGSALALGFVLTAVPSLPTSWRSALPTMVARTVAVLAGAAVVVGSAEHPWALAVCTVAAAVVGALLERVGATAGLAVVLIALDAGAEPTIAAAVPYALGAVTVFAAWTVWWGCAGIVAALRHNANPPSTPDGPRRPVDHRHVARVATAVALAVAGAACLPDDLVGGHWLVTSVLLTIQPGRPATRTRLVQRLSGNTVGAVLAAGLLGAHPAIPLAVAVTVALFVLALALRPVNYTWWAVTGPPVLLVVSEFPHWFPWYEGGIRLAMNLAGAAIVVLVVFAVPALARHFRPSRTSDSVYKIQREEAP